ncbi:hypothetical protein RJ641_034195 [Dillenia turbinata]|uniref:Uncharacterized protein n=1 Tax=Dillenia turbinata TaxID=194707 RepID=A0AAN8VN49_9MAGN
MDDLVKSSTAHKNNNSELGGENEHDCVCDRSIWLVKLLLLRGYTVRSTVRDPSSPLIPGATDP